ncbi:hypothetical protein Patl1_17287 [Pistacia atlantica]|uniref:Uncharacterized protein n=1 Tax=Pistacia atlantica TaxID=434234 RepID=A0ACC1B7N6_9ROSI|nr:hypothetical protein Patl1_17287 [Pistacia atlantica]
MMKKTDEENKNDAKTWGTWEELLLASAVKRHGLKNWESVAMELQTKTSLPHLLATAQCCKQKYHDLKRRFKDEQHEHEHEPEPPAKLVSIPWLEELRKVRVDELKQEVQRYDLNILSLQLKVKRLEEEREPALDIKTTQQKPDLDDQNIDKNDEPDKSEEPEKACKRLVSGEESDRENRSVNESNSTGLSEKIGDGEIIKNEAKAIGSGGVGGSKAVESDELGDSVTQLSSDVQSSASFGKKRKRSCGDSIKGMDVKSEPLIRLLELIRTHKHVSLFERRLKSQESNKYKEIVRQHVDLETIQTRVEQGSYSSCILTFYRDVLLVFNNAILYFPKSSLESATAFQLRNLFSNEIKKEYYKSDSSQDPLLPPAPPPPAAPAPLPPQLKPHLERSDSLLAKHKQSAPIIVCRKRSSVSTKPSTSSTFARQQQTDGKKQSADIKQPSVERSSSLLKVKTEEKAVTTGARSSRRSNRNPTTNTNNTTSPPSNKKQNATSGSKAGSGSGSGSVDKQETPKADKKKSEGSSTSDKKKSVVDFLKRIKKNSPVQTVKKSKGSEEQKKNNNSSSGSSSSSSSSSSGKKDKGKGRALWRSERRQSAKEENSPSKRSVGRPPKKTAETSGKRGREGGGKETVVGKRQSKRARR